MILLFYVCRKTCCKKSDYIFSECINYVNLAIYNIHLNNANDHKACRKRHMDQKALIGVAFFND